MRSACVVLLAVSLTAVAKPVPEPPAAEHVCFPDVAYAMPAAREQWEPMAGSPSVEVAPGSQVLRFRCPFTGTEMERASWDCRISLNLVGRTALRFLFFCADSGPVRGFSLYCHSGDGWYSGSFGVRDPGRWQVITVPFDRMGIEGEPAGWRQVDRIRVSAWRRASADTEFYLAAMGVVGYREPKVVVIRSDAGLDRSADSMASVDGYTQFLTEQLHSAGLAYALLSDQSLKAADLAGYAAAVLPYNPGLPAAGVEALRRYLENGGRLLAAYRLPGGLEDTVGIHRTRYIGRERPGQFAAIVPVTSAALPGAPALVPQASWNIMAAEPVAGRAQILARWQDDAGKDTGLPAVVASDNCVFLTHVLLPDHRAAKRQLLLAMLGRLAPSCWQEAMSRTLAAAGRFGPFADGEAAKRALAKNANEPTRQALAAAAAARAQAVSSLAAGKPGAALMAAEAVRRHLLEAYCNAQEPLQSGPRAFWCHSAFGVKGMTWDAAIRRLAENGFTAILPNMLWGGVAFYPSEVLPVAPQIAERGDQLQECLTACRRYGLQCHVWKVCFNMGYASPAAVVQKMQAAGRTQVLYNGESKPRWLCPSHPENRRLEIEAMLEVARRYPVDGLHFDYIRYPGSSGCFCSGCRQRFERAQGRTISPWPAAVRQDPDLHRAWLAFRRDQITAVVAGVADAARQIRPGIKLSAAVFPDWPTSRDNIGQDAELWCRKGYLDFVCPMDYTPSNLRLKTLVTEQVKRAGKVPCWPGIGLSLWGGEAERAVQLTEQIRLARDAGAMGFTVFNYGESEARDILPLLGSGLTRTAD